MVAAAGLRVAAPSVRRPPPCFESHGNDSGLDPYPASTAGSETASNAGRITGGGARPPLLSACRTGGDRRGNADHGHVGLRSLPCHRLGCGNVATAIPRLLHISGRWGPHAEDGLVLS